MDFNDPEHRPLRFAGKPDAFPQVPVDLVHGIVVQAAQGRCLSGG